MLWTPEEVRHAQDNDGFCARKLAALQEEQSNITRGMASRHDLDMFSISELDVLVKAETREVRGPDPLVVLPEELRLAALLQVHELVVAHMRYEYTYRAIRQQFWWQGISTDVRKVVDACLACAEQGYNAGSGLPIGEMMAKYCNHIFAMDTLSTGVTSTKGYQHVLVIIDSYTKFQQYVPLKMEIAEKVCET